jgi:hypothetical protein
MVYAAQTMPQVVYPAIAMLPDRVEVPVRAGLEYMILLTAPSRDGLRWIEPGASWTASWGGTPSFPKTALVHDLILTIGIYALVGFTVTPATLIGVLTILGYSLYDTVVVFDRFRENLRKYKRMPLAEVIDMSINEMLTRTIITSMTAVLATVVSVTGMFSSFLLSTAPTGAQPNLEIHC